MSHIKSTVAWSATKSFVGWLLLALSLAVLPIFLATVLLAFVGRFISLLAYVLWACLVMASIGLFGMSNPEHSLYREARNAKINIQDILRIL